jgi:hypothetical protein
VAPCPRFQRASAWGRERARGEESKQPGVSEFVSELGFTRMERGSLVKRGWGAQPAARPAPECAPCQAGSNAPIIPGIHTQGAEQTREWRACLGFAIVLDFDFLKFKVNLKRFQVAQVNGKLSTCDFWRKNRLWKVILHAKLTSGYLPLLVSF